ncbi:vesicle-associated membrane protein 2 [Cricetulus griseus]
MRVTSATAATVPPAAPAGEGGPPAPPPNLTSNRRLQQTQAQVDEVVDIMRVNVDKVLERDQKLSELDDRADALQAGASQFETSAAKLKRKYWWKNLKPVTSTPAYKSLGRPAQTPQSWVSVVKENPQLLGKQVAA